MANPKYYLVTVAKEASMICFVDEDNAFVPLKKFHPQAHPTMVFPSAKAANNFAKTHALKQAQCVAEKTFTAKRILACSAPEMTVSKEENTLPKPVAVAISPEPKAAPMPISEIFKYGEEMCNFSEGVAYRASEKGQNQLRALYRYLKDSGRIEDAERVMNNEHFANEMYEKYKDQLQLSK